jgi:DNA-binding PadR family transcriptional regulator
MPTRLGDFELLLLLTLARSGEDDPHGAVIADLLEAQTGRRVSPGAIYNALDRLERRGCVSSSLGDPSPRRGGKRKRHYHLEPAGRDAIAQTRATLLQLVRDPLQGDS